MIRKSYKVNNEEIKLIRDLKNQYKCVIFEQDMLKIIKEGPKNRKDFVDNLISDIRNDYSVILKNYNKVLFIRNEILKFGNNKKYFKERLICPRPEPGHQPSVCRKVGGRQEPSGVGKDNTALQPVWLHDGRVGVWGWPLR